MEVRQDIRCLHTYVPETKPRYEPWFRMHVRDRAGAMERIKKHPTSTSGVHTEARCERQASACVQSDVKHVRRHAARHRRKVLQASLWEQSFDGPQTWREHVQSNPSKTQTWHKYTWLSTHHYPKRILLDSIGKECHKNQRMRKISHFFLKMDLITGNT